MATTKVSALTALTTTDGAEELLINDGGTSKKVTIANLLHDNSIDSDHYVDGSIDLAHMSSESVDEDNLHISNAGSNGEFLSKQSGNDGGLTWAVAGGGDPTSDVNYSGDHDIQDLQKLYLEVQGASFDSDSTHNEDRSNEKQLYIRTIDSNNEGLFVKLKKNGSSQYVQEV